MPLYCAANHLFACPRWRLDCNKPHHIYLQGDFFPFCILNMKLQGLIPELNLHSHHRFCKVD
ncbi:hypothetical protein D3C87_2162810 [compost metagenome]